MRRLVAVLVTALTLAPSAVSADTLEPSQWPDGLALGSAPNALRFGGTDRYQTALAMSLALRGSGGFPFDTPDRTAAGAASLASTSDWWGAESCPRSVVVVAGDTPADALAAASLSDPTDRSDQPRLERVAAADPFFDPIGGFDRVDTAFAPIIVTESGRAGATALASSARTALDDLASGGCTTAREAIIVGGAAAVPSGVEGELVSLGYEEVFRVAGTDRFDTAARIATALGTEPVPDGQTCLDSSTIDGDTRMGFYGNAVIEFRRSATTCELRGRSVVLADGSTGADALAAGWWTSYWQVPVLLVDGDGSLPPATRAALQTLDIETLVVLGGTGRVPESVVEEASQLAGAVVGRFAGADRYETSAVMARVFGGWYGTGDADDFDADQVCVAASTGATVGWPDALAAGPFCGRLAALGEAAGSPVRALEPIEEAAAVRLSQRPSHDAVPVLLVPAGAVTPTSAVSDLLEDAFPVGGSWCDGRDAGGCSMPGFAVGFGGTATVSDAVLGSISAAMAGGDQRQAGAPARLTGAFRTDLDLRPVFPTERAGDEPVGCAGAGEIEGARWLASYDDAALRTFVGASDLVATGLYGDDGSLPVCVGLGTSSTAAPRLVVVSTSGRYATLALLSAERFSMAEEMTHGGPVHTEGDPGSDPSDGTTTWSFRDSPAAPLTVQVDGVQRLVAEASATLSLERTGGGALATLTGELRLDVGDETIVGTVTGRGLRLGAAWAIAGRFDLPDATGGFVGSIAINDGESNDDDHLVWRADANAI